MLSPIVFSTGWMPTISPESLAQKTTIYQTLDRPYPAANAVPQRITELLFVKGVTRRLLLGAQPRSNGG